MAEHKKPLRWRRQPSETGLRRVTQGPRGAILARGDEEFARVSACSPPGTHSWAFMWHGHVAGERYNSAADKRYYPATAEGLAAAMRDADEWVRPRLAAVDAARAST